MAKIIIDNQEVECGDGVSVLQAALESGLDIPHYCYHPGLKVVASCRLCLMEQKMPHPQTKEMSWSPKLVPSCQTPVRDGLEVRFNTERVAQNQKNCMEFFLLNHPLDCPVCDQAGECHLQDYSQKFGNASSRMVDQKLVNPKKDIGPKTLLYSDRCVMCSRCVRFTEEISGTNELCITNRGSRAEIDVFPGFPLDNPLQGNVVDICPVGCLLDKDFLFQRRVWELKGAASICPGCATGCAIRVDHADGRVYRLKPRFNPGINDWWMCDEGRFGFKYVHDKRRIAAPMVRRGLDKTYPEWSEVPTIVRYRFEEHMAGNDNAGVAALLSPFMSCEEAWLLVGFIRNVSNDATLAIGPVPMEGDDQAFPAGAEGDAVKFTILREKCPNRRGVEMVLEAAGGNVIDYEALVKQSAAGDFSAAWIAGGYPSSWVEKDLAKAAAKFDLLVVQDMFANEVTDAAEILLPACAWVERDGSFANAAGHLQPFARAIDPPEGAMRDGQYLFQVAGHEGLYNGRRVRELMAATIPAFMEIAEAPARPAHAH
ncbi:MAG: NADH-quinone oxidoreductase subunit G [Planctomycetota bacterium]|jgi:NADH-quinone oxidoreductase subunit G